MGRTCFGSVSGGVCETISPLRKNLDFFNNAPADDKTELDAEDPSEDSSNAKTEDLIQVYKHFYQL